LPAGAITGYNTDASFVNHGLVRAQDGTITTFEVLGAQNTFPQGTSTPQERSQEFLILVAP
jgi:hypothetical protein